MPRTLMPTPDEPRPDFRALPAGVHLDLEDLALRDFLRGEYVSIAPLRGSPCPPPERYEEPARVSPANAPSTVDAPSRTEQPDESPRRSGDNLSDVHVASHRAFGLAPLPRRRPGASDQSVFRVDPPGAVQLGRHRTGPFHWFRPIGRRPSDARPRALVAVLAVAVSVLAGGCGSGASSDRGSAGSVAAAGDVRRLAGVCPDPVVIQTSWFPESTHGGLYELVGPGYAIDNRRQLIRGPLVTADGVNTGVRVEIRPGGPARGGQQAPQLMYQDRSIMLGQTATEEQIGYSDRQPTLRVFAAMDADPVVYIWDKAVHPDWNTISDIGQTDAKVLSFRSPNADYLVGSGILRARQMDYSYDGSPARFVADRGQDAIGGFSTNEPWIYEHGLPAPLRRKVGYAYVSASNYPDYRNLLAIRTGDRDRFGPCLTRLVPILQRAQVAFMQHPDSALALIVRLVKAYHATYDYTLDQARWGVQVMRGDGLVSNGSNRMLGDFDPDRLQRMLDILVPIYTSQHRPVRQPLSPADLGTNAYLDPAIGLPTN